MISNFRVSQANGDGSFIVVVHYVPIDNRSRDESFTFTTAAKAQKFIKTVLGVMDADFIAANSGGEDASSD